MLKVLNMHFGYAKFDVCTCHALQGAEVDALTAQMLGLSMQQDQQQLQQLRGVLQQDSGLYLMFYGKVFGMVSCLVRHPHWFEH